MAVELLFHKMKSVLGGCVVMVVQQWILITLIVDSKIIKMIIFMLCVFYHRYPWWLSVNSCNAGDRETWV